MSSELPNSRLVGAVSRMPFSGKPIVRFLVHQGREAANGHNREGKVASALGILLLSAFHAVQMRNGMHELATDGGRPFYETAIDGLFTVAHGAVTATQAYLAAKVLSMKPKEESQDSTLLAPAATVAGDALTAVSAPIEEVTATDSKPERPPFLRPREDLPAIALTFAAQILFKVTTH